jgi:hypothetical protein
MAAGSNTLRQQRDRMAGATADIEHMIARLGIERVHSHTRRPVIRPAHRMADHPSSQPAGVL